MIFLTPPDNYNPKVSIVACFIECNNEVLFLHRAKHISQGDTWAIPAGKVDADETLEAAIQREVFEETTIELHQPEFLKTVYIRYPDYDFTYHMFRAVVTSKPNVVTDPKESQDHRWLTRAQADALEDVGKLILDEMPCILEVYGGNEFGVIVEAI